MCGIAGMLLPDGDPARVPDAARIVATMNRLQAHRGPDDEGLHDAPGIVLGHRRLSILDLSPRGHQPMRLADTPLWIVHNGEVYNYRELRADLVARGHHFRSETDTEVILAAYAQWGSACVERFNGMFAFAIWHAADRILFCARDRFGIKPFHYVDLADGTFAFASEIKAFHALPDFPLRANDRVVARFVGHGQCNATDETFVRNVQSLPAGEYLMRRPGIGASPCRYWDLQAAVSGRSTGDEAAAVREFRDRLTDSVRLRLRSDVPVGTCLSGGLDSSALVVAVHAQLSAAHAGTRQATFSACFTDPAVDERPFMRAVSAVTDTEPHEVYPSAATLAADLDDLVWHQDEPFGSTSIFAQRCVFRRAKEAGVTVTLDGQGADEVLGGYDAYAPTYLLQLRRTAGAAVAFRAAWQYARRRGMPLRRVLRRMRRTGKLEGRARPPGAYLHAALRAEAHLPSLLEPAAAGPFDLLRTHLRRDLHGDLLPGLLRYADRNSMTFGVESRVPFLDHRLVEFVYHVSADLLFRDGWSKWILRQAFADLLPPVVTWRRDKIGFEPPEAQWFREHLHDRFAALMSDPGAEVFERYVDHAHTAAVWRQFKRGGPYRRDLWRVLNLHLWLDRFLAPQLASA